MSEGKGDNTIALSPTIRTRLEMRGIACSNDPKFIKLVPWLRTTFVLCGTLVAIGTALAFTPLLWAMVPIAALGAILPVHPFDLFYNYGIRHLTGTQALPRNGAPTRFACGVAVVFLVATALAFGTGVAWLGYLLGGLLTAVAAIISMTHFCIPSAIYQSLFGQGVALQEALFGRQEG